MPTPDTAPLVVARASEGGRHRQCRLVTHGRRPTREGVDDRKRLNVFGGDRKANIAEVGQWEPGPDPDLNATWTIIQAPDSDLWMIVAAHSGRVLDLNDRHEAMVHPSTGGENQWWLPGKPEKDGAFTLRPSWSGGDKVLDVRDASRDNGARIWLWDANGGNHQLFMAEWL